MLYSMVVAALVNDPDLHLTLQQAGILNSVTLLSSAAGGIAFGVIADRFGRTRALMGSVLLYSIFTALCGFAQTALQLAVFRVFLGLGMGGEWASGASLVSEWFPTEHRGKALGFMQSSWAIGYGLAAFANLLVAPRWGWRGVFFIGIVPALFVLWVRRGVEEPPVWRARTATGATKTHGRLADVFSRSVVALTVAVTLMNACTMFGWWALNSWVPAYLRLQPDKGGIGLSSETMSLFVIAMQVGMWFGYVSFGFVADAIGRRRAYVMYLIVAGILLPLYGVLRAPAALLLLGPFVAFFGTGYFSGFGALTAEIYPTAIRATAQGFTYNVGRVASALAPFAIGTIATTRGFGFAFSLTGAAFLLAASAWIWIPETRGKPLE
jgi:MFS family permease